MSSSVEIYSRKDIENMINERIRIELKPIFKELERIKISLIDLQRIAK